MIPMFSIAKIKHSMRKKTLRLNQLRAISQSLRKKTKSPMSGNIVYKNIDRSDVYVDAEQVLPDDYGWFYELLTTDIGEDVLKEIFAEHYADEGGMMRYLLISNQHSPEDFSDQAKVNVIASETTHSFENNPITVHKYRSPHLNEEEVYIYRDSESEQIIIFRRNPKNENHYENIYYNWDYDSEIMDIDKLLLLPTIEIDHYTINVVDINDVFNGYYNLEIEDSLVRGELSSPITSLLWMVYQNEDVDWYIENSIDPFKFFNEHNNERPTKSDLEFWSLDFDIEIDTNLHPHLKIVLDELVKKGLYTKEALR